MTASLAKPVLRCYFLHRSHVTWRLQLKIAVPKSSLRPRGSNTGTAHVTCLVIAGPLW